MLNGFQVGFKPEKLGTRSIHAGGIRALLLARVNTNIIGLVRMCHIKSMMCYLHTSVQTFTSGLAEGMVQHGDCALIPPSHVG